MVVQEKKSELKRRESERREEKLVRKTLLLAPTRDPRSPAQGGLATHMKAGEGSLGRHRGLVERESSGIQCVVGTSAKSSGRGHRPCKGNQKRTSGTPELTKAVLLVYQDSVASGARDRRIFAR